MERAANLGLAAPLLCPINIISRFVQMSFGITYALSEHEKCVVRCNAVIAVYICKLSLFRCKCFQTIAFNLK